MNKTKTFLLFSCFDGGYEYKIRLHVLPNGSFRNKGKIDMDNHRLRTAKQNAKKRGRGFHLISLIHEGCGYHHVNLNDVVAIPLDIHAAISHELSDGSALRLEGVLG